MVHTAKSICTDNYHTKSTFYVWRPPLRFSWTATVEATRVWVSVQWCKEDIRFKYVNIDLAGAYPQVKVSERVADNCHQIERWQWPYLQRRSLITVIRYTIDNDHICNKGGWSLSSDTTLTMTISATRVVDHCHQTQHWQWPYLHQGWLITVIRHNIDNDHICNKGGWSLSSDTLLTMTISATRVVDHCHQTQHWQWPYLQQGWLITVIRHNIDNDHICNEGRW